MAAAAALWLILGSGCQRHPDDRSWPEGAAVTARTLALDRLLARLETLGSTPLGRRAGEWRQALPGCVIVEGHAPHGDLAAALDSLTCASGGGALEALHARRGDRDLAFAWPAGGGHVVGAASLAVDGSLRARLSLPAEAARGPQLLLLPGEEPAGARLLSASERLLSLRVRPAGGIDVASLVAAGSQADRLFRLKSELFSGVALDGTWELALYLPEAGSRVPRAALALGVQSRRLAVAAMQAFVGELQAAWPVHPTPFAAGDASGSCLLDLKLMPDLAPCYAATEEALVIGWNAASVARALATGRDDAADESSNGAPEQSGELSVDFDQLARANAILAGAPGDTAQPERLAWRRARAHARRAGSRVDIAVALESEARQSREPGPGGEG